ncbi:hypothetical protein Fcan01_18843 [Folsomia candida]|uniref:DUF962 domain-containing protein n=1 Tax=Folsomia candida TaxID=158441 RepID=A0A226DNN5_FOLCA|nr:hypothetical protein Fcan01_18843 [Folsomia candida]
MGITDLEEQFTFYASYHHSTLNKLIHIGCVWPILWSAFVLSEYIPLQVPFIPENPLHPPNITLITALFYAGVYIMMDKKVKDARKIEAIHAGLARLAKLVLPQAASVRQK